MIKTLQYLRHVWVTRFDVNFRDLFHKIKEGLLRFDIIIDCVLEMRAEKKVAVSLEEEHFKVVYKGFMFTAVMHTSLHQQPFPVLFGLGSLLRRLSLVTIVSVKVVFDDYRRLR